MNRIVAVVIGLVLVAVAIRASTFIVDQRQFAIVFQLGEIVRVVTQPGLYFKLPLLQNVEYQDSRILTIDTPQADRVQTSEKKNLLIDSFVRWRISEPRAFRVSFPGGERSAEERISTLVLDMLTFSKEREPEPQAADLNEIASEVIDLMASRAAELNVELIWRPAPNMPVLMFDPEALHRAITAAIEAHGGRIEVRYEAHLYLARRL